MRLDVRIQEFHVHVHLHDEDETAELLKQIQDLQAKVMTDTTSMSDTVEAAKEGT